MIENIVSTLFKHGDKDFTDAFEVFRTREYDFVLDIKGFSLRKHFTNTFNMMFQKFPLRQAFTVYVGFRSGLPHSIALQVSEDQFRLIDNNVGILRFKSLEELLDALSDYRTIFYGKSDEPQTVAFAKACARPG